MYEVWKCPKNSGSVTKKIQWCVYLVTGEGLGGVTIEIQCSVYLVTGEGLGGVSGRGCLSLALGYRTIRSGEPISSCSVSVLI